MTRGFKREAIREGFLEEVVCELDGVSTRSRKMQQSLHTQVGKWVDLGRSLEDEESHTCQRNSQGGGTAL